MSPVEQRRVAGNWYDKYGGDNPVARWLVSGFERDLVDLMLITGANEAHEVGCSEALLNRLLAWEGWDHRGSDVSSQRD